MHKEALKRTVEEEFAVAVKQMQNECRMKADIRKGIRFFLLL